MGTTGLSVCPGCNRHVRCGERACPFCGAKVASVACVLEYRVKTRLDRGRALSLGAALAAAGFASSCDDTTSVAIYGAPCNPPSCVFPGSGAGNGGSAGNGGASAGNGGASAGNGGAGAGSGGVAGTAGGAGSAGASPALGSAGGDESGGGAGGNPLDGAGGAGGNN